MQPKGMMEGLAETAKVYYNLSAPNIQQLAHKFFKSLDNDNDGKVSVQEFLGFMQSEGHVKMSNRHFFKELDKDGNGTLEFMEVMTLYYIIKSGRPFCGWCHEFIAGMYFTCSECFDTENDSFSVCPKCFEYKSFGHKHVHNKFLDNYALLEAKRKQGTATYSNQNKPNSSVTITEVPTSSNNAVIPYNAHRSKWHGVKNAFELLNFGVNAASLCTIL